MRILDDRLQVGVKEGNTYLHDSEFDVPSDHL